MFREMRLKSAGSNAPLRPAIAERLPQGLRSSCMRDHLRAVLSHTFSSAILCHVRRDEGGFGRKYAYTGSTDMDFCFLPKVTKNYQAYLAGSHENSAPSMGQTQPSFPLEKRRIDSILNRLALVIGRRTLPGSGLIPSNS